MKTEPLFLCDVPEFNELEKLNQLRLTEPQSRYRANWLDRCEELLAILKIRYGFTGDEIYDELATPRASELSPQFMHRDIQNLISGK